MFIGHYSAALALKRVEKKVSLGWLFLAVQFVDILFFPLVLLGVERLTIVENFTLNISRSQVPGYIPIYMMKSPVLKTQHRAFL